MVYGKYKELLQGISLLRILPVRVLPETEMYAEI